MDTPSTQPPRLTPVIGASTASGEHDPLLDSLAEEARSLVRGQLASLEARLGGPVEPQRMAALLDEAYRAAHGLRLAIDPERMPAVDRLARLLQAVVQATRDGILAARPELCPLLASVARIARESLERREPGGPVPSMVEPAVEALQDVLANPGSWEPGAPLGGGPAPRFTKVETARLRAAVDLSRRGLRASDASGKASAEAWSAVQRIRDAAAAGREAQAALLDAIPAGLAAAARGEPLTEIAAPLAAAVSGIQRLSARWEEDLERFAAAVADASAEASAATAACSAALRDLDRVRLSAVLEDVPERARHLAKELGIPIAVSLDADDHETDTGRSDLLHASVTAAVRALIVPEPFTGKRLRVYTVEQEYRLRIRAARDAGRLGVRIQWTGDRPEQRYASGVLASHKRRLEQAGCGLEIDCGAAGGAAVLITLPATRRASDDAVEHLLARAGGSTFAIPSRDVVECMALEQLDERRARLGAVLGVRRASAEGDPRVAVIIRAGESSHAILVDAVEGPEPLAPDPTGAWRRAGGGTVALIAPALIAPEPKTGAQRKRTEKRKRKRKG
jgi:chemotaxis protein histidine kinase CheA